MLHCFKNSFTNVPKIQSSIDDCFNFRCLIQSFSHQVTHLTAHSLIPLFESPSFHISIFNSQCSIISILQCSNAPSDQYFNASIFQCSNVPMLQCSYISISHPLIHSFTHPLIHSFIYSVPLFLFLFTFTFFSLPLPFLFLFTFSFFSFPSFPFFPSFLCALKTTKILLGTEIPLTGSVNTTSVKQS